MKNATVAATRNDSPSAAKANGTPDDIHCGRRDAPPSSAGSPMSVAASGGESSCDSPYDVIMSAFARGSFSGGTSSPYPESNAAPWNEPTNALHARRRTASGSVKRVQQEERHDRPAQEGEHQVRAHEDPAAVVPVGERAGERHREDERGGHRNAGRRQGERELGLLGGQGVEVPDQPDVDGELADERPEQ